MLERMLDELVAMVMDGRSTNTRAISAWSTARDHLQIDVAEDKVEGRLRVSDCPRKQAFLGREGHGHPPLGASHVHTYRSQYTVSKVYLLNWETERIAGATISSWSRN